MIKIIHLSDIHIDNEKFSLKHDSLINSLLLDIEKYVDENTILIISGDFLNQGGKNFNTDEKYNVVKLFINKFIEKLPILEQKIFFVPGNHEISRNDLNEFIDLPFKDNLLDKKNIKGSRSSETLNRFLNDFYLKGGTSEIKGLHDFNFFAKNYFSKYPNKLLTNLDNSFKITLPKVDVGISCINSSWLCYDDDDEGNIAIGLKQLENSLKFIVEKKIKICILHHPLNFLPRDLELSEIEKFIYKNYDIILVGHTHEQVTNYVNGLNGNYFISVGRSLTAENSKFHTYKNGYSVIEYNHNENVKCLFRKFDDDSSKFISSNDYGFENGLFEVNINNNQLTNFIKEGNPKLNNDFESFLLDAGAKFTNKSSIDIKLNDIYVQPFFERYDVVESEEKSNNVTINFLHKNIIDSSFSNIVLFGEENSGKTSFCKITFEKVLKESTFFPVYMTGKQLKETHINKIEKTILKEAKNQYDNFQPKHKEQIYLIIDDFNESKLSFDFKRKLINSIIDSSYKSIIIWDEYLTLNELLDIRNIDANIFEILPFGSSKRFELIKKWKDLTFTDEFVDEKDKVDSYYSSEKIIDSIIGKNLVPSLPIYILIILQSNEITSSNNLEQSTFGYYYDVLIKSAIGTKVKENKEIEKIYSYLSELAFEFYLKKSNKISEDNFINFHKRFNKKYDVETSFVKGENILIDSEILRKKDNFYKFKYTYIYFYFVAKYFSENIDDSEVIKEIKELSNKLYQSHSANIYLFLSHHSKSKIIIDEVVNVTDNLFSDSPLINFNNDIDWINSLIEAKSQDLELDSFDYTKNKENDLEAADSIQKNTSFNEGEKIESLKDKDLKEIDFISKINISYKSIEILGHIVKNRYASLKGEEKNRIIETIYNLGIKTLSSIFNMLIDGEDYIKSQIIDLIGEDNSITETEKELLAKKIMFNMLYMISYSTIKKISSSVASKDLRKTFENVENSNPDNNAFKLITMANKFDYSKQFPFDDVKNLKDKFDNNILPFYILRRLGYNFLRLKPIEERIQQKISNVLDISIKSQRLIEGTSKIK